MPPRCGNSCLLGGVANHWIILNMSYGAVRRAEAVVTQHRVPWYVVSIALDNSHERVVPTVHFAKRGPRLPTAGVGDNHQSFRSKTRQLPPRPVSI